MLPIEVDLLLIGFDGDGGYGYKVDKAALEELLGTATGASGAFTCGARDTGGQWGMWGHRWVGALMGGGWAVGTGLRAARDERGARVGSATARGWRPEGGTDK